MKRLDRAQVEQTHKLLFYHLFEWIRPHRGKWQCEAEHRQALSDLLTIYKPRKPKKLKKTNGHYDGGVYTVEGLLNSIKTTVKRHASSIRVEREPLLSFFQLGQDAVSTQYYRNIQKSAQNTSNLRRPVAASGEFSIEQPEIPKPTFSHASNSPKTAYGFGETAGLEDSAKFATESLRLESSSKPKGLQKELSGLLNSMSFPSNSASAIPKPEPDMKRLRSTFGKEQNKSHVEVSVSSNKHEDHPKSPADGRDEERRHLVIPQGDRERVGRGSIEKRVKSIEALLWQTLCSAFKSAGLRWYDRPEFAIVPCHKLEALYEVSFGVEWREKVSRYIIGSSLTSVDVFVALIGAAIYSKIFSTKLSWEKQDFVYFSSELHEEYAAARLKEKGLDLGQFKRDIAIAAARDPRFVQSDSRLLTSYFSEPLQGYVCSQTSFAGMEDKTSLAPQISHAISDAFAAALALKAELHAAGEEISYDWFLPGEKFDADRMFAGCQSSAAEVDYEQVVATTVLPWIGLRNSRGQIIQASPAIVIVCPEPLAEHVVADG